MIDQDLLKTTPTIYNFAIICKSCLYSTSERNGSNTYAFWQFLSVKLPLQLTGRTVANLTRAGN